MLGETTVASPPWHFAAGENENPAVITALLDVGADATVQDNSSNTPWDYAQDNEALRGDEMSGGGLTRDVSSETPACSLRPRHKQAPPEDRLPN